MVEGMAKYTIGALTVQRAVEGFIDPLISEQRGFVIARFSLSELRTSVRRNIRADMDYEDVRDGLGFLLLDARMANSYELEMACMSFRAMGFEPVMEVIDGSLDEESPEDQDDVTREFSLRSTLCLRLDDEFIRLNGIVDLGSEP